MPDTSYATESIEFICEGSTIVGRLFVPQDGELSHEAVVLIGPVAFVKEQSPLQYATRLAKLGYVTLIFDPRFSGESGGEPRRLESGSAKTADLRAAASFLLDDSEVEVTKVHLLAVCQGVNWAIKAAGEDTRFATLTLIAGNYLSPAFATMTMGAEQTNARVARALQAKETYESTGVVEYLPIVKTTPDQTAHLPYPAPFPDWYLMWGHREPAFAYKGGWENRIALMSEAELWTHDVVVDLAKLELPVLMVHSDRAATGPVLPRQHFEIIPSGSKQLIWLEDQVQMQFYDDPLTIDSAVDAVQDWLVAVPSA